MDGVKVGHKFILEGWIAKIGWSPKWDKAESLGGWDANTREMRFEVGQAKAKSLGVRI